LTGRFVTIGADSEVSALQQAVAQAGAVLGLSDAALLLCRCAVTLAAVEATIIQMLILQMLLLQARCR